MPADTTIGAECVVHGSPEASAFSSTQVVIVVVVAMILAAVLVSFGHPVSDVLQVIGGVMLTSAVFATQGSGPIAVSGRM